VKVAGVSFRVINWIFQIKQTPAVSKKIKIVTKLNSKDYKYPANYSKSNRILNRNTKRAAKSPPSGLALSTWTSAHSRQTDLTSILWAFRFGGADQGATFLHSSYPKLNVAREKQWRLVAKKTYYAINLVDRKTGGNFDTFEDRVC
jgi:hypothetical protein